MLHPSYNELIEKVNNSVEVGEEPIVNSRYSIVIAAAKRARQLISDENDIRVNKIKIDKPLSIAVQELSEGKVNIIGEEDIDESEIVDL